MNIHDIQPVVSDGDYWQQVCTYGANCKFTRFGDDGLIVLIGPYHTLFHIFLAKRYKIIGTIHGKR